MTDLEFREGLIENPFSFGNTYQLFHIERTRLFFSKENNYPFIFKSGLCGDFELLFSNYVNQLGNRVLSTKKLKEIMNGCGAPIKVVVKHRAYLIGKGFLAEFSTGLVGRLLFVATINQENVTNINQVKFFISRIIYEEVHKAFHPLIKDLIGNHPGDITICNNITDYITERISFPKGGSIADRKRHTDAVVRTALDIFINEGKKLKPATVGSSGVEYLAVEPLL